MSFYQARASICQKKNEQDKYLLRLDRSGCEDQGELNEMLKTIYTTLFTSKPKEEMEQILQAIPARIVQCNTKMKIYAGHI